MKWYQHLFSVTNNRKHKILTILGLKFKFLRSPFYRLKKYGITLCGRDKFKHEGIYDCGKNNVIILKNGAIEKRLTNKDVISGLELYINGDNNYICIEQPCRFIKTRMIIFNNNSSVVIKKTKYKIDKSIIQLIHGAHLEIGEDISVATDLNLISSGRDNKIIIGDDVMFSGFCWVRNNDEHKIYNENNECINLPENTFIGNHCWITHGCVILKGSYVPSNSILGTCSIYTAKSYNSQEESDKMKVFAGSPAKLIREDYSRWER